MITKEELVKQLKNIGLTSGDLVNVKVSLKSIGKIEGGPNTLIDAILEVIGEKGTMVCDSFNPCIPRYTRCFHKKVPVDRYTKSYAGAFVNAVINRAESHRSKHPIQAFSAIGLLAEELTQAHTKNSFPYSFLEEIANRGGKNLRIGDKVVGVGTTHIPICKMGFKQKYIPEGVYYTDENGEIKWFEHYWASGCHKGFNNLFPYYSNIDGAILGKGLVGEAGSLLTDMSKTLACENKLLSEDGTAFFCGDPGCLMCSFTWKHSKYSLIDCVKVNFKRKRYKKIVGALLIAIFGTWHG